MSKAQSNIDNSFKQKFENFTQTPPDHVWEGVKAGLVVPATPSFFIHYWKGLTIAAIAVATIISGIFLFKPKAEKDVVNSDQISVNDDKSTQGNDKFLNEYERNITEKKSETKDTGPGNASMENDTVENISVENADNEIKNKNNTIFAESNNILKENQNKTKVADNKSYNYTAKKHGNDLAVTRNQKPNKFLATNVDGNNNNEKNNFELTKINNIDLATNRNITPQLISPILNDQFALDNNLNKKKGAWSLGFYLSPEMMLSNFDSVEMLTNYSLGVEPSYSFNDHLFIRFGLNATYSRDRGFAKLDYLSYDLLGSYEYVYNITFDSIDGEVVPTYHTYNMDVWDTIRHLEINAITNQYYYIQTPLLIGYYKNSGNFKWYFYGGPSFNLLVSKQIDKPLKGVNYIELLNLRKELPERSPYYFQVWFGAGIEYKIGNNLGIAFEPNYRYYLNNVFKEQPYNKSGLSGLTVRFGLVYTIQ